MPTNERGERDRHAHGARVLETSSAAELAREIARTGCEPEGIATLTRKGRVYAVRLDDVPLRACPLLKQELLAVGGDSAHARGVADLSVERSPVVLLANWGQYQRVVPQLRHAPLHLSEISDEIDAALREYGRRGPHTLAGAHRSLVLGDRPRLMGVVNVTPDSFSDGGRFLDREVAIAHARRLADEGASVVDIGGESTRPGAAPVSSEEAWRRIGPVIEGLRGRLSVPLSVDTRHAEVARRAIDAGADIINDVGGLSDPEMRRVVRETSAAAIAMHMRGEPRTMQQNTRYADLRGEVYRYLAGATDRAVREGIDPARLAVDPGIGFGKSFEQSLELVVHAGEFRSLGYPVVIGASRKSFLGWAVGDERPEARADAGLAAAVLAADRGAELLRVHEVAPTLRALAVVARARALASDGTEGAAHGPGDAIDADP